MLTQIKQEQKSPQMQQLTVRSLPGDISQNPT